MEDGSVLELGNLGGKRHPSINNIPLSFLKLKDSFPLSQMVAGGQSELRILVTFFQFSSLNCPYMDDK